MDKKCGGRGEGGKTAGVMEEQCRNMDGKNTGNKYD